jgi:hypothetical protein
MFEILLSIENFNQINNEETVIKQVALIQRIS